MAGALALGALGALLIQSGERGLVASAICWSAVILLLFAFYDFRVRPRERRTARLHGLRLYFERRLSGEQSLDFDRSRWIHEANSVKTEAAWATVSRACEHKEILWFAVNDFVVFVPKRAVDEASLEILREAALGPAAPRFEARVGLWDYLSADVPELWRRKPYLRALTGLGCLFLLVSMALSFFSSYATFPALGLVAFFGLAVVFSVQFSRYCLEYFTPRRSRMQEIGWDASPIGIYFFYRDSRFFLSWSEIKRFKETNRCVLFFTDQFRYYIVSKRNRKPEDLSALRELLAAKLI